MLMWSSVTFAYLLPAFVINGADFVTRRLIACASRWEMTKIVRTAKTLSPISPSLIQ
jgi:hypothetical protein